MSEKMILIPYSEYQELTNRPEDYKAIKVLEQEPILDKIRAEIEQSYCAVNNDYDHGRNYGLYIATQIIDKYKAEKSCRNCKYDNNDVYGYCCECFLKIQDHYERKNKE